MIVKLTGQFENGVDEIEWVPDTVSNTSEIMKVGRFVYERKADSDTATYMYTEEQ